MSRFYPIIDYDFSGPLGPGLARELAASGCGMLQLRAKGATSAQFFSFSQQVLAQVHSGCRVIINDRFDIALACGAAGVHLGEHDLPVEAVRGKCPRAFIIGATVRDPAAAAAAETHGADYLGAGAVFPTGSKSDTRQIGLEALGEIARAVRIPVYGIAGVTLENCAAVVQAGAYGAAGISAVAAAEDPAAAFLALENKLCAAALSP